MNNIAIRNALKESGIRQWQLAEAMETSEYSLSRKLRHELPNEEKTKLLHLIESMAKDKNS